ncbi:hypothetical protein IWX49DRAFT_582019 [Phyllosticta citricarpa]
MPCHVETRRRCCVRCALAKAEKYTQAKKSHVSISSHASVSNDLGGDSRHVRHISFLLFLLLLSSPPSSSAYAVLWRRFWPPCSLPLFGLNTTDACIVRFFFNRGSAISATTCCRLPSCLASRRDRHISLIFAVAGNVAALDFHHFGRRGTRISRELPVLEQKVGT